MQQLLAVITKPNITGAKRETRPARRLVLVRWRHAMRPLLVIVSSLAFAGLSYPKVNDFSIVDARLD